MFYKNLVTDDKSSFDVAADLQARREFINNGIKNCDDYINSCKDLSNLQGFMLRGREKLEKQQSELYKAFLERYDVKLGSRTEVLARVKGLLATLKLQEEDLDEVWKRLMGGIFIGF